MGDAKRGVSESEAVARRVIAAGDVALDWNLARTRKLVDSGIAWNATDRTDPCIRPSEELPPNEQEKDRMMVREIPTSSSPRG
jgi:hypothetical protein